MTTARHVPFMDLGFADLQVDTVYEGGKAGNIGDDPLGKLLPVGNAGGFRFVGSPSKGTVKLAALFTSNTDPDWPDTLDLAAGTFTYYGDNKAPGRALHDTPRKGNLFLREVFELAAGDDQARAKVPPVLLFSRADFGHDMRFRGLLVPGARSSHTEEDLVAVWRSRNGERFQNYRATWTVLDVNEIDRTQIDDWLGGDASAAPRAWQRWVRSGVPEPLMAPRIRTFRSRDEQLPKDEQGKRMLEVIRSHFASRPHDFEECAAAIWTMIAPATDEIAVTRRSRDGGRDAVGRYVIGPPSDRVPIDFALEAKCYAATNSVGVREVSRLISRLRHRNFGVLVTTSFVNQQAYEEIRDDGHPVAIVSGADIVDAIRSAGIGDVQAVTAWLSQYFPVPSA